MLRLDRKILAVPDAVVGGGEVGERFAVVFFEGFDPFDEGGEGYAQNVGKFALFEIGGLVGGVGPRPGEHFYHHRVGER